ncbi:MAG: ubiquinone/menaquinone biosynthesis methyltransferase [Cellvibrionaceae bacterium]
MSQSIGNRNQETFTRLANDYDKLNSLMTMGLHRHWRREAVSHLQIQPDDWVLDLAAGTGDMAMAALPYAMAGQVSLIDNNAAMLEIARQKLGNAWPSRNIAICRADGHALPFPDHSYDKVMIGFGLRLDSSIEHTLGEAFRVLRPGGRCVSLDLSEPDSYWFKPLFKGYLQRCVPLLARLAVEKSYDYHHLPDSAKFHPDPLTVSYLFESAGFINCATKPLMRGALAVHVADKGMKAGE